MNLEGLLTHPGRRIRLAELDPSFTSEFATKSDARERLRNDIARLAELQDVFAAASSHALLVILQGMDSAGKDGAIKHVMSGVNPQGIDVYSFKTPTEAEERHDFLWRCEKVLPERGRIGIFNRSYYEEVIVVRVHPGLLALEAAVPEKGFWSDRFEDINTFERHLDRNGTIILKFFLHLSKDEQRKRLLKRLDDENKNWKFSADDIKERRYWDRYQSEYEQMLNATTTSWAPWYVIPADHKWFMRTAIAAILVAKLESLGLSYPRIDGKAAVLLKQFRDELEAEAEETAG
jgi:PPK2 family polyphosphate:nucleotide phosphotransferase